ncbi:MAG TPA: MmgE/PrpD family protein [Reyranella sp.]
MTTMNAMAPTAPTITGFSRYIATALGQPLPADIMDATKNHLLDTIGAIVSGSHLLPGEGAIRFLKTEGGTPQARVPCSDITTTAGNAAWAMGMMAHADETDDHHLASITHPGCCVVPAALAAGEYAKANGEAVLRAVALGYDITTRIGMALTNRLFFEGRATVSFGGIFGASASAAGLLGLNEAQIRYCLSYAAQQAAGARSWQRDTDHMEKAYVMGGAPARNGVQFAQLAAVGFTGVEDVFSGDFNFFDMFMPGADQSILLSGLGVRYEIARTSIKKWCVGGPIQAPLDGLWTLLQEGVRADDIVKLDVRIASKHASVVDNRDNSTINVQHILGLMLADGSAGFAACHDMERMQDPAVLAQKAKVNLIYDTEMDKLAPRRPVDVEAALRDGSKRQAKAHAVRGTADNPMNFAEVETKALDLMEGVVGEARAKRICGLVMELDRAPDLGALMREMSTGA